jgi:hypothetical protein
VFVLLLSKNGNNNGFDSIGLSSLLFDYRFVVYFHFDVVSFIVSPRCFL